MKTYVVAESEDEAIMLARSNGGRSKKQAFILREKFRRVVAKNAEVWAITITAKLVESPGEIKCH